MKKIRAILAAASLILLTACGGGGDSSTGSGGAQGAGGTAKVKVNVIPIIDVAPIYLGKEQGFFAEQGLEVELVTAQGGAAIVPAVVSGQVEFGFSNLTSLIIARSQQVPVKVVVAGAGSTGEQGKDFGGIVVKAGSPIKSAKDLEGKRVAVNTLNNINDTTVRASVRAAGGDPKKINFVELPFPDMLPALDKGTIDAAQVVEPFLATAVKNGDRVIASNYVDTAPKLTVAAYFTSEQLAQSNPDLVQRFAAAMKKSQQYAEENPDAVRKILPTYTKIDASLTESLTLPSFPTEIDPNSVETLTRLAVDDGLITTAPDGKELLP
ncbi:NitT/TauT family transport system substrate-binding protein [Thermopolyspora flexuosa]|uniref:NitT/TauT family transport system substrate-binding protein n=1 Tax=Thermopolyspora flexuosa TaxID=103836 RepID=A0A543IX37_9ACTN|nr:NitT/TauT family transport system substrate-binding protein [Thermopolyspora flexuosa]